MSYGRLEAQWVLSAAQTMTLTITAIGGPYTITIPAGSYYPAELASTIQTQLDAATGADGAFTVSYSKTDGTGTGLLTIAHATQTFTLAFTSATFRTALGFAADLTPAALTFTGTAALYGVWIPDCPFESTHGLEVGQSDVDASATVSPRGHVYGLVYQTRVRHPEFRWPHVTRARARRAAETVTSQSFESWYLITHGGESSFFVAHPKVRIYSDSTNDTLIATYYLDTPAGTTSMEMAARPWQGLFSVVVGGFKVPT